jgi:hypothetical protein
MRMQGIGGPSAKPPCDAWQATLRPDEEEEPEEDEEEDDPFAEESDEEEEEVCGVTGVSEKKIEKPCT